VKKLLTKKQLVLYIKLYEPSFDIKNLNRMNADNLKILLDLSEERYLEECISIKK
tara:strand:+ start:1234 stop:1398 length:165 start_codon:yes stop_codon:yes gene_type:complete